MISTFDDLLLAAGAQGVPQRLLMVFAAADLPEDATAEQRAGFVSGHGGALAPLMCVDKRPEQLASFAQLCAEADSLNSGWCLVLAGALSGQNGLDPTDQAVDDVFQRWLEHMRMGRVDQVLAQTLVFTRDGTAVQLQA